MIIKTDDKPFGPKLRAIRERKGITRAEATKAVFKKDTNSMAILETGAGAYNVTIPTPRMIEYARYLGVTKIVIQVQ